MNPVAIYEGQVADGLCHGWGRLVKSVHYVIGWWEKDKQIGNCRGYVFNK